MLVSIHNLSIKETLALERIYAAVRATARMMGRDKQPALDGVQTSLRPIIDTDLPYWISTDREVWATTDDEADAVNFAKRLAVMLAPGERVVVTMMGFSIYTETGHGTGFPPKDAVR